MFSISFYTIPIAVVIAGSLISGAVMLSAGRTGSSEQVTAAAHPSAIENFRLPSEEDHVRGNPAAKVAVVEFSDLECPFCARLHPTLMRIVEENPDVKWVYRHFPLTSIHSRAFNAAIASECVAKLGGRNAFWDFTDAMFSDQKNLGDGFYAETAAAVGVDATAFASCVEDRGIADAVQEDANEAVQSGGRGTPFVVVVTASGKLTPFSGALPYSDVKRVVDQALVN